MVARSGGNCLHTGEQDMEIIPTADGDRPVVPRWPGVPAYMDRWPDLFVSVFFLPTHA